MNPSQFRTWPWSSVFQNSEHEQVAINIITILGRTGDKWRELSWDEYLAERKKDGGGNTSHNGYSEKDCFANVQPYTVSVEKAASFSPSWSEVAK